MQFNGALMSHSKIAIVTGVSAGLGAGIAEVFCRSGIKVIGMARRNQPDAVLVEAIAAEGGDFEYVQGDVSVAADCTRAVERCLEKHGRIDVLINNAAIAGVPPFLSIEDVPESTLNAVMGVNLNGAFFMAQRVLPIMKQQRDGVIINIASVNGVFGTAKFAPYNASKAALIHLSHTLATEGAPYNIRSNSIILGSVRTEMNEVAEIAIAQAAARTQAQPTPEQLTKHTRSWMEPVEVARAIELLCRPEARLITGADIAIDGGISAGVMATYAQRVASKRLFDTPV